MIKITLMKIDWNFVLQSIFVCICKWWIIWLEKNLFIEIIWLQWKNDPIQSIMIIINETIFYSFGHLWLNWLKPKKIIKWILLTKLIICTRDFSSSIYCVYFFFFFYIYVMSIQHESHYIVCDAMNAMCKTKKYSVGFFTMHQARYGYQYSFCTFWIASRTHTHKHLHAYNLILCNIHLVWC